MKTKKKLDGQVKFEDGEMLPLVGGPHNGENAPISIIFPFLDGGVPSSLYNYKGCFYSLNRKKRCWEYCIEVTK